MGVSKGIYSKEANSLGDNDPKTTMKWFAQFDNDYPAEDLGLWKDTLKKMEGYKFAFGVQQEYNQQKEEKFMPGTIFEGVFSTSLLETENELNWGSVGEFLGSAGESLNEFAMKVGESMEEY